MTNPILELNTKAEELYLLRREIAEKEEECKTLLAGMKERRDALQEELMASLREIGLSSVKTSSGDSFALAKRKGLAITNEVFAHKAALEVGAIRPDLVKLAQLLKDREALPKGLAWTESEYISVRKAKQK